MKFLGFPKKNVIAWFKQKFKTNINTNYSSPSNLICGVPQVSILGTLLLLLYINDLPQVLPYDSLLYEVNACIVFQEENITESEKQRLNDFASLCDWSVDNKLSVHFGLDKTKLILFGTKHQLRNAKDLNIVCNSTENILGVFQIKVSAVSQRL